MKVEKELGGFTTSQVLIGVVHTNFGNVNKEEQPKNDSVHEMKHLYDHELGIHTSVGIESMDICLDF